MSEQRREREVRCAREAIAQAAAAVFAEKGFHGATLDEIARRADYSAPALYRYYPSKAALFAAVIRAVAEDLLQIFDEPQPANLPYMDRLRWLLARQLQLVECRRDYIVAFHAHRVLLDRDVRSDLGGEVREWYLRYLARISDVLAEGVREGALGERPATHLTAGFAGIVSAFVLAWLQSEEPYPLETQIEPIIDLFLNGAGAAPKAKA